MLIIVHDYMFVMTKITLLGLRPTFVIKGSFGSPEKKKLALILLKQILNFACVYIIMLIIVICLLMEKE